MPRKEFESFTRLDASDVNTYLMDQSVMTFAGTAARGSAIGTATEGMYTHLEDSDALQFWNGSAWISPFGLTLVKSESFSAVASVSLDDVFTSAFDKYKILWRITPSTTANVSVRVRAGGTDNTASSYFRSGLANNNAAATVFALNVASGTLLTLFQGTAGSEPFYSGFLEVDGPALNTRTLFHFHNSSRVDGQWGSHFGSSLHNVSAIYDGITFLAASGTMTGDIKVYGYRN
jgi:hypothetical protein